MITQHDQRRAEALEKPRYLTGSRDVYLANARRHARTRFNALRAGEHPTWECDFRNCHESHAVAEALRLTEIAYPDLGTYGVEGSCDPDILYLNAGDPYVTTILYWKGQFRIGCWGDIVEREDSSDDS